MRITVILSSNSYLFRWLMIRNVYEAVTHRSITIELSNLIADQHYHEKYPFMIWSFHLTYIPERKFRTNNHAQRMPRKNHGNNFQRPITGFPWRTFITPNHTILRWVIKVSLIHPATSVTRVSLIPNRERRRTDRLQSLCTKILHVDTEIIGMKQIMIGWYLYSRHQRIIRNSMRCATPFNSHQSRQSHSQWTSIDPLIFSLLFSPDNLTYSIRSILSSRVPNQERIMPMIYSLSRIPDSWRIIVMKL